MKIRLIVLFTVLMSTCYITLKAQVDPMTKAMVKMAIEQYKNMQPEDKKDEVIEEGVCTIISGGTIDLALNKQYLDNFQQQMSVKIAENGYSLIDDEEYPTNRLELKTGFFKLPIFQKSNVFTQVESVKNANGENILLSQKEMEEYRELGIIN